MSSSLSDTNYFNQANTSANVEDERVRVLVSILKQLDFNKIEQGAMMRWSVYLATFNATTRIVVPLGYHGEYEYALNVVPCKPGSLNALGQGQKRDDNSQLVDLITKSDAGQQITTALVIGRLQAIKDECSYRFQSHWIVVLDEHRVLWVLYAQYIDQLDIKKSSSGRSAIYLKEADIAFGADVHRGEVSVCIGNIDDITFNYWVELTNVNVDTDTKEWSTRSVSVSSIGDVGLPMFASGFRRLLSIDLTHVKVPKYKNRDFHHLVDKIRYVGFRKDLLDQNQHRVPDRQETEAAYLQVLLDKYQVWPLERLKKYGERALEEKQKLLREALEQVSTTSYITCHMLTKIKRRGGRRDDVEKYWKDIGAKYPALDVSVSCSLICCCLS